MKTIHGLYSNVC